MNFINSFNVQGEPCAMGYNKLVVPFTEMQGLKIPVICAVIMEVMAGEGTAIYTKEEFLQFFGGALPETTGSYLLVENLEDSTGFSSKWTENVLTEKYYEQKSINAKVYTISLEDMVTIMDLYPSLAGDDVNKLILLATLGFIIINFVNDGEEIIILSTTA